MGVLFQSFSRSGLMVAAGGWWIAAFLSGCASTVDTITGQRFREAPFHTLFHRDDPVEVLRHSQVADDRAKAMLQIKEPRKAGRPDAEQEEILKILSESATSDKQAICRLRAIEALGRFEDPRASQYIVTAYQNAAQESSTDAPAAANGIAQASRKTRLPIGPVSTFTQDTVLDIQCRALETLGKKRSPEGLELLCSVARRPVKKEAKPQSFDPLIPSGAGLEASDLRLAALRALENYHGDKRAAATLYEIMRGDVDVSLKGRAHMSLVKVTGHDWPPQSPEWEKMFPAAPAAKTP